jgi:hypothetical protein
VAEDVGGPLGAQGTKDFAYQWVLSFKPPWAETKKKCGSLFIWHREGTLVTPSNRRGQDDNMRRLYCLLAHTELKKTWVCMK